MPYAAPRGDSLSLYVCIHDIIMTDSRYLCIILNTTILDILLTSDLIVKAGEGVMVRTVSAPLQLCSRRDKTILASPLSTAQN